MSSSVNAMFISLPFATFNKGLLLSAERMMGNPTPVPEMSLIRKDLPECSDRQSGNREISP